MSETKMTQTQKRILFIGLVPLFMSLLSVSSINVVLPSISSDIHASTSALQWVLTGYALSFVESSVGWFVWLALPLGLAMIWVWTRWERRYARLGRPPMVDLDLFRIRSFSNGSIIITLYFLGVTSVWVLVAMYMQQGLGHSALAAGMIGLPAALLSAVSADVSGRFVFQIGRRLVVWGIVTCLVGLIATIAVVLLLSQEIGSEWWMLLTLAFIGTAQGMVISPNQTLTLQEVPLKYAGSSGGVLETGSASAHRWAWRS
ncbi:MFS transporter [Brevibacterium oceani]|uniref:MFS transporter n=1 Tax=Brevibacterium oceani TaxID=358099 RepID=UPI001FE75B78|nr:MFS transporter [Brevibacterium oceani]